MILANAAIKTAGCPCCVCCCTVQRQIRGFDLTTGTYNCFPAVTLTKTINGSAASWPHPGASFPVCLGDTLSVSGFPETVTCSSRTYRFATAALLIFCDGVYIKTAATTNVNTATLTYAGMVSECACAAGQACEVLVDVHYVYGSSPTCGTLTLTGVPAFVDFGVCQQIGAVYPPPAILSVPMLTSPGSEWSNLLRFNVPGYIWNVGASIPCSMAGRSITVTIPKVASGIPLFNARWAATGPSPSCVINAATSHAYNFVSGQSLSLYASWGCDLTPSC